MTGQYAAGVAAGALKCDTEMRVAVALSVRLELFYQRGFKGSLHPDQGMAAQVGSQGIGQVRLKAGDPDAINLLFEFGNRGHVTSCRLVANPPIKYTWSPRKPDDTTQLQGIKEDCYATTPSMDS